MVHALGAVYCLWWMSASCTSIWIFCDARVRRLDGSFKFASLNCILPWLGLWKYLKYRRAALAAGVPALPAAAEPPGGTGSWLARNLPRPSTFSLLSTEQKVAVVVVGSLCIELTTVVGLIQISPIVAYIVIAPSLAESFARLCLAYMAGAFCCVAILVAVWSFGLVDFATGRLDSKKSRN